MKNVKNGKKKFSGTYCDHVFLGVPIKTFLREKKV